MFCCDVIAIYRVRGWGLAARTHDYYYSTYVRTYLSVSDLPDIASKQLIPYSGLFLWLEIFVVRIDFSGSWHQPSR